MNHGLCFSGKALAVALPFRSSWRLHQDPKSAKLPERTPATRVSCRRKSAGSRLER